MKLSSFVFHCMCAVLLAIAAAHSWAGPIDLVEITGNVGFSSSSGNGGFEPDTPGSDFIEGGPFRLVYDPSILDTDPRQDRGFFPDAIRSFSMTVYQERRPPLVFSLVGTGDFRRWIDADHLGEGWLSWEMTLKEQHNVIPPSIFRFGWWDPVMPRDPNQMPATNFWFTSTPFEGGGGGAGDTDWLMGRPEVRTIPRPVPAPPSLWLLLIGAAAAHLQRRAVRTS